MTSRPRVYTRIRPLNATERNQGGETAFSCERGSSNTLVFGGKDGEQVKTRFDFVFDSLTTQSDVFGHVGPEILDALFRGYNATAFAYGQTGSGKTHTMEGGEGDLRGITPRLLEAIFNRYTENPEITDATMHLSMVQIYQEKVQDLMQDRMHLEIHMDRTGQYIATEAHWEPVRNVKEALQVYRAAVLQRATNATEMNLVSSRSHMILMVKLQWDEPTAPGSKAQLNLVDLAGSEKLSQSGAVGNVMKEAIAINKSLSALGNVVSKLVDAAKHRDKRIHVPYKDSKLTYLLQSSLGGSNLVHFMLALSASALWRSESNNTVEFGKRALQLVLKPVRNPIDYKRLEEMEAMIEKMRNKIRSLEDELKSGGGVSGAEGKAFLGIKSLRQEGEAEAPKRRGGNSKNRELKSRTELSRIIANLPETLEDLTSHCVLFPSSRAVFRDLGGIEKLVGLISGSQSTFYRAHAAHTLAHVIDDDGRDTFRECGGMEALERLLEIKEERCKEAACIALEAVTRGCNGNKEVLSANVYQMLSELLYGYPNQQVTESACTAVASIVDLHPQSKVILSKYDVVTKLLKTISEAPDEIVHVTKAAATCIGRLAHGDTKMQDEIRELGGVELLIYNVLFSPTGERDHQVPILGSYALVNLCCSNEANMALVRSHDSYQDVCYRLMEGLARAFGVNTVREGFGRAETMEKTSPFPYYGVCIQEKWTPLTCGGRPIFSTFMESPQFQLQIEEDTLLTILIQDTLYEQRMQQKQKNSTVYMGLAIFQGDEELSSAGLKQIVFHGQMRDIAKFTSNCENAMHCKLPASKQPYILVPFTSQRGRCTNFALSVFGDRPLNLMQTPEAGWARRIVHGNWTQLTGVGGEASSWRNNPQIVITTGSERTRVVFVLSYLSLDEERNEPTENDTGVDGDNNRPRLNARLFITDHGAAHRYVKAFVPLPQQSTYVAANSFASNSYINVSATLEPNTSYVFIPFTQTPHVDTWRTVIYSDTNDIDVTALDEKAEWHHSAFKGTWKGEDLRIAVRPSSSHPGGPLGKVAIVVSSQEVYIRAHAFSAAQQRIATLKSFWHHEAYLDVDAPEGALTVVVEALVRSSEKQSKPNDLPFEIRAFSESGDVDIELLGNAGTQLPEGPWIHAKRSIEECGYPRLLPEGEDPLALGEDPGDEAMGFFGSTESEGDDAEASQQLVGLQGQLDQERASNARLQAELKTALEKLSSGDRILAATAASNSSPPPPGGAGNGRRASARGGTRQPLGRSGSLRARGAASASPTKSSEAATRIATLASRTAAPSASEWSAMREELRQLQAMLANR